MNASIHWVQSVELTKVVDVVPGMKIKHRDIIIKSEHKATGEKVTYTFTLFADDASKLGI